MLAPAWGVRQLYDIDDREAREHLGRCSVMVLSYVAQAARGVGRPMVPESEVDKATTITERFLTRWRGEPNPDHVRAIDAYWTSAAEHGMNASTFAARVVASTGADAEASLSAGAHPRTEAHRPAGPPQRQLCRPAQSRGRGRRRLGPRMGQGRLDRRT